MTADSGSTNNIIGGPSTGDSDTDADVHGRQSSAQPLLKRPAEQETHRADQIPATAAVSDGGPLRHTGAPVHDPPTPPFSTDRPLTHQQFLAVVEEVRLAINAGMQPQRIQQGSSGSYFCRNRQGQIVGVFKPKNEEPYGKLNPKWTKWLHKTCCPCCFGRSCLIPNLGYISEAAASVVDQRLSLNIVPRTEIVSLASPAFYYSYIDQSHARRHAGLFPPKIGSFQLFMHGYMDATKFLRDGPAMLRDGRLPRDAVTGALDHKLQRQFQRDFEHLAVLDFIIRNTDRGLDNWMVRYDESEMMLDVDSLDSDPEPSMKSDVGSVSNTDVAVQPTSPTSETSNSRTFDMGTMASTDAVKSVAEVSMRSGGGPNSYAASAITTDNATVRKTQPRSVLPAPNGESIVDGLVDLNHQPGSSVNNSNTASRDQLPSRRPSASVKDIVMLTAPSIHIAAIDNGLAFPFKHPDQWRSYPYGWASLPAAKVPFSRATRDRLIPLLTSRRWWDELTGELRQVFEMDVDFDEKLFRRQVAVMKGQVYNLVHTLQTGIYIDGRDPAHVQPISISPVSTESGRNNNTAALLQPDEVLSSGTPLDLVRQAPCLVWEDADVRDLVGGELGQDIISRQGFLGTIIGMEPVPSPTTTPEQSATTDGNKKKHPKKNVRMNSAAVDLESGLRVHDESAGGTTSDDDDDVDQQHIGEFLTSPTSIRDPAAGSASSQHYRSRRSRLSAADITHNLDAFRGRVITFVKSQPWFSNW